jgi:hypothetical protein
MFARAVDMVGSAAAIAGLPSLGPKLRRDIIAWLAPLEHVVRKLLLAEAAELHRAEREREKRRVRIEHIPLRGMAMHQRPTGGTASLQARSSASVKERCEPEGSRSNLDKANPETWRAQFSFALPRPRYVANANAPRIRDPWAPTPPPAPERALRVFKPEDTPFRLARRLEALRRVLEDPRPHALRLARALTREGRRINQLALRYLYAPCRTNDYDRDDPRLGLDAMAHAFEAPYAFDSS